jgi:hypothetical protein
MRGGAFFVSSDFGNYELRGTNFDRLRWRAVFGEFTLAANSTPPVARRLHGSLTLAALRFLRLRSKKGNSNGF